MLVMGPGRNSASATVTSPLGSRWIQRGCLRPVANALTLSPGAATGVCPGAHPLAVGILSVGMLPCGLAAGIAGLLPTAGSEGLPCSLRQRIAAPPTSATMRANMSDNPIASPPVCARTSLVEAHLRCNPRRGSGSGHGRLDGTEDQLDCAGSASSRGGDRSGSKV